jgi:hypothetical protein
VVNAEGTTQDKGGKREEAQRRLMGSPSAPRAHAPWVQHIKRHGYWDGVQD